MSESSMSLTPAVDVEAQPHYPSWNVEHNHMLRSDEKTDENTLGFFIFKLPDWDRQPPEEFSPLGWRFGLHNRENLESGETQAIKLAMAEHLGLVGEKWVHFCEAIVEDPKSMLACYGLTSGVTSWTDEQIRHVLALDALFLASYMDLLLPDEERRLWGESDGSTAFWTKVNLWWSIVARDLVLVENQIPLALILKVAEYFSDSPASEKQGQLFPYRELCREAAVNKVTAVFMGASGLQFDGLLGDVMERVHIVGAAYEAICGMGGYFIRQAEGNEIVRVPTATKLQQSGIRICGVPEPLCSLSYQNQCLRIPKMVVYGKTESFVRNMAWYERTSAPGRCVFHNYILFMIDLIDTPEDLELLIQQGVIDHGYRVRAFEMWMSLKKGLAEIPSSQAHHEMKQAIVSRCRQRRYRLWSEFNLVFCSRPWFVLSTIAVVLVTLATLVQTYISIIGSNRMKPSFP